MKTMQFAHVSAIDGNEARSSLNISNKRLPLVRLLRSITLLLSFAVCNSLFGISLPYASPKFQQGGSGYNANYCLQTNEATLAFANLTLDDVAQFLDDGYVFGACGNYAKSIPNVPAVSCNQIIRLRDEGTGKFKSIVGAFDFRDDKYIKSIAFELTDGKDGVYVQAKRAQFVSNSKPNFYFIEEDGKGGVIYSCDSGKSDKAGSANIAVVEGTNGYGCASIALVKVIPADAPIFVWSRGEDKPVLTLDDIKDYNFTARSCGSSVARNYLGTEMIGYNKKITTDASDSVTSIRIEFQFYEHPYLKCVIVELTNGERGIYARQIRSCYKKNAALGHKFALDDGTFDETGSHGCYGYYGRNNTNIDTGYAVFGLCAVPSGFPSQMLISKMTSGSWQHWIDASKKLSLLSTSWKKVFDGLSLQQIVDGGYEISGWICGRAIKDKSRVLPKQFLTYTPVGETTISNAVCSFTIYDGKEHTKNVSIELETRSDGTYAKYGKGQFLRNKNNVSFQFVTLNEEGSVTYACDVADSGAEKYSAIPTSWNTDGYGIAGLAASRFMRKDESDLVWSGVTLDDIKDCYFGCSFAGGSITRKGREGIGLNRHIQYEENGSAKSMSVEFQTYDGNSGSYYAKCVVVKFTNGVDGVYGYAVGAAHSTWNYGNVGYEFTDANGNLIKESTDNVATSTWIQTYGIYDLFATPMVSLDADADWSGSSTELNLGAMVVDLNGHRLTVDGVVGDGTLHAKIVNSADATAELRCKPPKWMASVNTTVKFGKEEFNNHNIKFVKDGLGKYTAAVGQSYSGGTEIVTGTLKAALKGDTYSPFGKLRNSVRISQDGILDMNGQASYDLYPLVIDGGTLANSGVEGNEDAALTSSITLEADSTIDLVSSYGLTRGSHNPTTLDLGGHTLSINMGDDKKFYIRHATVSEGTVNLNGGCLQAGLENGTPTWGNQTNTATSTDFNVNSALCLWAPFMVRNYTALYEKDENLGNEILGVYGTFKPSSHNYYYGCTMMDGSTLDLSQRTETLPLVSAFTSGKNTLEFANDATVFVKLGDRQLSSRKPIISWAVGTDIGNVRFKRFTGEEKRGLVKQADGLYLSPGLVITFR